MRRAVALAACAVAAAACRKTAEPAGIDPNQQLPADAGLDGGTSDAGPSDAGPPDAGPPDAGPPPADPHKVGGLGKGPWPVAPITVYGAAQGLFESPISASTDEAENIWVVSNSALYVLKPGDHAFHRYTAADGLHLGPGWTEPPDITLVTGGRGSFKGRDNQEWLGECFVGYYAHDTFDPPGTTTQFAHTANDPIAHMGKMDQVLLKPDGKLEVHRYDFHNSNDGFYYETRTVMSAVYDHFQHPGELYVGSNHGVTRVQAAKWRLPANSAEQSDPISVEREWYADHVHPVVCDNGPCVGPSAHIVFGDFFGLTLAEDGRLWMGGLTSASAIRWTPDLQFWWHSWRPDNPFDPFFGDPYPGNPPVFNPPKEGDQVNISAIAVTTNGTVWFASGGREGWREPHYGLASYDQTRQSFLYVDPGSIGAPEYNILELVAWDDTLVLGFPSTGLLVWKPGQPRGKRMGLAEGLPGEAIGRLSFDRMVDPPQLFVPTEGGLAVLRALPK